MKESEQRRRIFLAFELIANVSATMRPFQKGETGSVKGETKSANFGKGKCKLIANFSATMVTSLPSISVYRVSLSLSPSVPHAQYRKYFRASYHIASDEKPSEHVTVAMGLAEARPNKMAQW